jgi:hypothetical protein
MRFAQEGHSWFRSRPAIVRQRRDVASPLRYTGAALQTRSLRQGGKTAPADIRFGQQSRRNKMGCGRRNGKAHSRGYQDIDPGLRGSTSDILALAAREERIILTFDKDFGELAWLPRIESQLGFHDEVTRLRRRARSMQLESFNISLLLHQLISKSRSRP